MTGALARFLHATAIVFLVARPANGQALADTVLHPGSSVRVESIALGSNPREGTFVTIRNDTLSFRMKGEPAVTRIAVAQVSALEVSPGRTHNIIRDADQGSHYGGWVGAAVLGTLGAAGAPSGDNGLRAFLGLASAAAGYFVGRMYGTIAGGVAGAVDLDDVWKPVMLPARGAPPIGGTLLDTHVTLDPSR